MTEQIHRDEKGLWQKGQTGNPAGRPPSQKPHNTYRKVIYRHVPEILAALIEKAKRGDCEAAALLLDRTVPSLKVVEAPEPTPIAAAPLNI